MLTLHSRLFRCLIAWSVVLYPFEHALAQAPTQPASSKPVISQAFLTDQAVVAACLRPHQLLTNPDLQMLPVEVAKAVGEKHLGMDLANVGRVIVVVEPPFGQDPQYAVVLQANQEFDLNRLSPELTAHTTPGEMGGRAGLISRDDSAPCFMVLNKKTMVAASKAMLEKLMDTNQPDASGVLADLIASHPTGDDLYIAADLESLQPLWMMGMGAAAHQTPPEFRKFLQIPNLIQSAELTLNLNLTRPSQFMVHAADAADADHLESLVNEGFQAARERMRQDMQGDLDQLRSSDDPVERALAAYADRVSEGTLAAIKPARRDNSLAVFQSDAAESQQMTNVAVVGVLVALLLPAVQAAREAARRSQSMNNLKQLMLALLNYESANGELPPHAIYSADGKPLLSWRVAVLPYLEQQELYNQFHLDEPWDSPHNRTLIDKMPEYLLDPSSSLEASEGRTSYLAVVGDGLLFEEDDAGTKLRTIVDGLSNTLALLQVNDSAAEPWTKPADWQFNPAQPFNGLGGPHPGIFLVARGDGSVIAIAEGIDPLAFAAMLTRAGND